MKNDSPNRGRKKHKFSADRPIGFREEDLLGRSSFADSLASAIKGWKGNDSLVIALYGPWGSGKSSVKNMVLQSLRSSQDESPLIVEFNPWQWAGQNQLAAAFFREIGLVLGRPNSGENEKKRAAKWKEYAATWKAGSFVASGFRKIVLFLLALVGVTGLGSGLLEPDWLNGVWTSIGGVASILFILELTYGFGGNFSEKIAAVLETRSKANIQSLKEQKAELTVLLQDLERPILVVIDDVDRLAADEIRLLFQLVKVNADFPNLVYLVLFQRDVVERSLDSSPAINGQEFLEKIVQVGFDIPRIERARLEKVLFAGLDELLAEEDVGRRFDQRRWGNLFLGGLRPYFQTLRDVYRYLASLSFHVSLFRSTGSFEVNPMDLIALEVLRVFEPTVYQGLPEAKLVLTNLRDRAHDSHDQNERTRKLIETVINAGSQPEKVREIIKQLFPPVEWVFSGPMYGAEFADEWFRELRLCHSDVFDRYFHLTIPEGDISQTELDRILSLAGNREGLVTEFQTLNERGLLGVALNRLEPYKQNIDLSHAVPFVTALFDIGDELPEGKGGVFLISPDLHAWRIIHWFLKKESDTSKRGRALIDATNATTGLYLPIQTASLENDVEKRQKDPNALNLPGDALSTLKQICVEKIEQAAKSGFLANHPNMLFILYRWSEWSSPGRPREWVEKLVESQDGIISFLAACLHRSTSQGMGDYVSQEHWRINIKTIEDFIPFDTLEGNAAEISCDTLNDKQKKAFEAFQKASKRRKEGKSDDDWRDDEGS